MKYGYARAVVTSDAAVSATVSQPSGACGAEARFPKSGEGARQRGDYQDQQCHGNGEVSNANGRLADQAGRGEHRQKDACGAPIDPPSWRNDNDFLKRIAPRE
jgi:hypothetical protein